MKVTVKQLKQLIREQVEEMSHAGMPEARRKPMSPEEVAEMNAEMDRFKQERLAGVKKELKVRHPKAFKFVVSRLGMEAIDNLIEEGEYAAGMNGGYGYTYSDARLGLLHLLEKAL